MPLTVRRIGQEGDKPKLNLMVYGIAGTGKTTLAAQAQDHPDLAPVLFADLEGGTLSIQSRRDIDSVRITTTDELDELFWDLSLKRNGFGIYKTVVIDSGTNLANRALVEWIGRNQERAQKKNKRKGETLDDVQLEDYGKMTAQVRRLLSWYRDLDINLIVTALARFDFAQDADQRTASPIAVYPDFTQKLGSSLVGLMDHAWYIYANEDGSRSMLTSERGVYRAKTRGEYFAPALGHIVDDPYLPGIYDLLLQTEVSGFASPEPEVDMTDFQETEPEPYDDTPEAVYADDSTEEGEDA